MLPSSGKLFAQHSLYTHNYKYMIRLTNQLYSWDLGGQVRFRNMWERYCIGATSLVYVSQVREWDVY